MHASTWRWWARPRLHTSSMGIPRLITHLRPYAVYETVDGSDSGSGNGSGNSRGGNVLPPSPAQAWRRRAIIDGPALAYHVYYAYLAPASHAARSSMGTALSSTPYRQLGHAALAWLDKLQSCGLTMYCLARHW